MTGKKNKIAENEAVARAVDSPVSTKMSIEICDNIRGKNIEKAIAHLESVAEMKRAIVIRKFNRDLGHKPGYGPARYPVNAAKAFVSLLKLAKANAENKGLNSDRLVISFAKADFGAKRWHYGRQRRTKMKNTHIEIRVRESEAEKKQNKKEIKESKQ